MDPNKGHFTVYWRGEDKGAVFVKRYGTSELGYRAFEKHLKMVVEDGHQVRVCGAIHGQHLVLQEAGGGCRDPGAGIITPAAIRAYVDDIGRFVSYKIAREMQAALPAA